MIFDLRIYTLRPEKVAPWLKLYEVDGYPVQLKYLGKPVLYAMTEIGPLNQAIHIWQYESHGDRDEKRARMAKDPAWQTYLKKSAELAAILTQENRLMKSTSFSPL